MNEKIRQLAEQAIDSVVFSKIETIPQMEQFAEKFAELIVKECCVALHPMLRDMISRGQGVDLIRKHLGVK